MSVRRALHLALTLAALVLAQAVLASPARAVDIVSVKSDNGIEAWLVEDHSLPLIAFQFSIAGGAALDPTGKEGLAGLVMDLLDEGAGDLDAVTYKARLETLSVQLEFSAEMDSIGGSLRTLTQNSDEAMDLLRIALTKPRFDAAAVERVVGQLIAGMEQDTREPRKVANRVWWRTGFPDKPYGRRASGTPKSISAIAAADLHRFAADRLTRAGLTIGVVGDVTPDRLKLLLDRAFGELPARTPRAKLAEEAVVNKGALMLVRMPIPQSVVVFGSGGVKRDSPDWYAALLMNQILGGSGLTSRLAAEIREKRGLAYGVSSSLFPLRHAGVIVGQVATRNDRVAETIAVLRAEWRRLAEQGPTPAELDAAKNYLIGSFPLNLDSSSRMAALLVSLQIDNLGIDFLERRSTLIEKITLEDVQRVARRLLDPDKLRIVVVGSPTSLPGAREVRGEGN